MNWQRFFLPLTLSLSSSLLLYPSLSFPFSLSLTLSLSSSLLLYLSLPFSLSLTLSWKVSLTLHGKNSMDILLYLPLLLPLLLSRSTCVTDGWRRLIRQVRNRMESLLQGCTFERDRAREREREFWLGFAEPSGRAGARV